MSDIDNFLSVIQERAFTKSRIVFWEQTLPGIVKALYKASLIAKKYRQWHGVLSKKEPGEWDDPAIELTVSQQSVIGSAIGAMRKKQGRFTEKYTFTLSDGNNAEASQFKRSQEDYVIESWEETLKA